MDGARLRHLQGFDGLSRAALEEVGRHVRLLRLPAGRWLVRPGRRLPGRWYLLRGRVRVRGPGPARQVAAPSAAARLPVYPGAAEVVTLTPSEVVAVPRGVLDGLADAAAVPLPALPRLCDDESWQQRFLASPLMQRLSPAAWQRVLRAMARHGFGPREAVVRAGEPAACCYVLTSGEADVLGSGGRWITSLRPGALFGEDALLSGGHRNATVRMRSAGSAVSLPAACFEAWLVSVVTAPLADPGARRLLNLDDHDRDRDRDRDRDHDHDRGRPLALARLREGAAGLPTGDAYAVVGGSWRQRRLAAFLLAERGLDARPLGIAGTPPGA